jgi:hypothetical protein
MREDFWGGDVESSRHSSCLCLVLLPSPVSCSQFSRSVPSAWTAPGTTYEMSAEEGKIEPGLWRTLCLPGYPALGWPRCLGLVSLPSSVLVSSSPFVMGSIILGALTLKATTE